MASIQVGPLRLSDTGWSGQTVSMADPKKKYHINLRIDAGMMSMIHWYAYHMGLSTSEAVRVLIKQSLLGILFSMDRELRTDESRQVVGNTMRKMLHEDYDNWHVGNIEIGIKDE